MHFSDFLLVHLLLLLTSCAFLELASVMVLEASTYVVWLVIYARLFRRAIHLITEESHLSSFVCYHLWSGAKLALRVGPIGFMILSL